MSIDTELVPAAGDSTSSERQETMTGTTTDTTLVLEKPLTGLPVLVNRLKEHVRDGDRWKSSAELCVSLVCEVAQRFERVLDGIESLPPEKVTKPMLALRDRRRDLQPILEELKQQSLRGKHKNGKPIFKSSAELSVTT